MKDGHTVDKWVLGKCEADGEWFFIRPRWLNRRWTKARDIVSTAHLEEALAFRSAEPALNALAAIAHEGIAWTSGYRVVRMDVRCQLGLDLATSALRAVALLVAVLVAASMLTACSAGIAPTFPDGYVVDDGATAAESSTADGDVLVDAGTLDLDLKPIDLGDVGDVGELPDAGDPDAGVELDAGTDAGDVDEATACTEMHAAYDDARRMLCTGLTYVGSCSCGADGLDAGGGTCRDRREHVDACIAAIGAATTCSELEATPPPCAGLIAVVTVS